MSFVSFVIPLAWLQATQNDHGRHFFFDDSHVSISFYTLRDHTFSFHESHILSPADSNVVVTSPPFFYPFYLPTVSESQTAIATLVADYTALASHTGT